MHLVTSADGAQHDFKTTKDIGDGTHKRFNVPETAIMTDQKLQKVWSAHQNQIIIPATQTFEEKCSNVTNVVLKVAQAKTLGR